MTRFLLSFAMLFAAIAPTFAAEPQGPTQKDVMPVFFEVKSENSRYPVLAEKDGEFFQVFTVKEGRPYFADAKGVTHFVFKKDGEVAYKPVYLKGDKRIDLPTSSNEKAAKTYLAKGSAADAKTKLVCWGRRYYGYSYAYAPSWGYVGGYGCYSGGYYAPSYYGYGYGYGYASAGYAWGYAGGYYAGGYYGGAYYGGGYGGGYIRGGYGCVINGGWW